LVRLSYREPVDTFATNVMGTVHIHEAAAKTPSVQAIVNVTTDKCYLNNEWVWPYREHEPLGGHDPYSASKACSEIVSGAYRSSFGHEGAPRIATGRAGNVIGGGDWATDRLIPDAMRAILNDDVLTIRHPNATRPWQHVLEPICGYLTVAAALHEGSADAARAWNFGPSEDDARPVAWILDRIAELDPRLRWQVDDEPNYHEANFLRLDSSAAKSKLGWRPRWTLVDALGMTVAWYRAWASGRDAYSICDEQIGRYLEQAVR
jgi:CDP-glucose 4,6-dehydratase